MANEKFKFMAVNADGNQYTLATENHPKLDASQEDMGKAATALKTAYDVNVTSVVLTSDTTVWTFA